MKKLTIIALISVITFNAVAQKKYTDTAARKELPVQLSDTTAIVTAKDFEELNIMLGELPAKYANPIYNWVNKKIQDRANEWYRNHLVNHK